MQSVSPNGVMQLGPGGPRPFGGKAPPQREPLNAVLELGRNASRLVVYALIGAMLLHAAAIVRAEVIPIEMMNYRLFETYEIELLKPPALPPTPPEPEPEPVKETPKEPPPPAIIKETVPAAAPAAAKAGAVLTAPPDPDAPANFDGIISGSGETFAGGNTGVNGTSDTAVRTKPLAAGGVPGGTGTAKTGPVSAVDHTRVAGVSGSKDWNCPFPPEADSEQIDQAFPTIQVAVRADGSPERVTVLSDPGHGFGRAATRCAMQQRYSAAMDHDGNPIPGLTKSISVRFER